MRDKLTNPLNPFAFVAILSVGADLYHSASSHELPWIAALRTILAVPFLVFCFRNSPLAWLVSLLSVLPIFPLYLAGEYFFAPTRFPSTRVLAICMALYAGCIIYMFAVRERYRAYLHDRQFPPL